MNSAERRDKTENQVQFAMSCVRANPKMAVDDAKVRMDYAEKHLLDGLSAQEFNAFLTAKAELIRSFIPKVD
jgi:hypothetical protein